eukprot:5354790-Pyramimonas_sp.AAC.1
MIILLCLGAIRMPGNMGTIHGKSDIRNASLVRFPQRYLPDEGGRRFGSRSGPNNYWDLPILPTQ